MPELLEHVSDFLDLPKGFALDKQSFDDATDTPEEKQKKVDEADEKTTAAAELSKTLAESKVRGLERVKGMFASGAALADPAVLSKLRPTLQRQRSNDLNDLKRASSTASSLSGPSQEVTALLQKLLTAH